MKRQTQFIGVRNWYGPDFLSLQEEPLKVLDSFFGDYGSFVISGCRITPNGAKHNISAGLVVLEGPGPDGTPAKIAAPFDGATSVTLPVYLSLSKSVVEDQYNDGEMKPITYDYRAVASSVQPSGDYITITASGVSRLGDVIQDTTHRFITDTERTNWNAKETTVGAQEKATAAVASAKVYTDTRETAIRADMTSGDTAALASAKVYTDTRETAVRSSMTSGDSTTLASAKAYTDTREASILSSVGERSITITNFDTFNPYGTLTDRITGASFTLEIGQSCAFYSGSATGRPTTSDGYSLNPSIWTGRVYRANTANYVIEAIGYYTSASRYPIRATRAYYAASTLSATPYSWRVETEYLAIGTSGYVKFPSGMMIQWGTVSNTSTSGLYSVVFSPAFSSVYNVQTSVYDSAGTNTAGYSLNMRALSEISFSLYRAQMTGSGVSASTIGFRWFAIGTWV